MIRVAIVEDNRTVRESLETIINLATGCQCVGAWSTAEEALASQPAPLPDVVLMDLKFPNRAACSHTHLIKERLPAAKILMLTVYEDPDGIAHALAAGACGYLLKRSSPEQIITAIRQAHQGETHRNRKTRGAKTPHLGS